MFNQVVKASKVNYNTSLIKVTVRNARPPIEIGGARIDLGAEGMEIQLPRWVALKLAELGIVEIKSTDEISLRDLLRILWRETREINLTEIDPNFYPKLQNRLKKLREEANKSPLPELIQDLRRFEVTAQDIINCRVQKIVQAAICESLPINVLEAMTIEEKALLREISRLVERWKRQMLALEEE
ncbi:MAG: hypothetical protein DRJ18_01840 [Candidatus Methanomethylicota archaeon]|nr:DNA replication complex GINS family protein [Candidatus Culexmicrobium cathedralense]RLE48514.1 MAG: hypothetical protein DRJ18_01840 [Candidatus Verstraetearchaeota archaeon]